MDILLTGSTGFLGKSIYTNQAKSFNVITLGRNDCDVLCDLSADALPSLPNIDMVIHCAGKAHIIPKTDQEKKDFFNVNVKGTKNLLEGLEKSSKLPESFIYISTVAVYGISSGNNISENEPLLAKDPYGLSKIQAENLIITWCNKNDVICTILRLPLLAGTNPPGNLKAMINGIKKGYYFNIAGGKAKKSMVLVDDVAKIIPIIAPIGGVYNLTDGYHPSFAELSALMAGQLNKPKPRGIPYFIVKLIALAGDIIGSKCPINSNKLKKITSDLTFDDTKIRQLLHWQPTPVLKGLKL